MIIDARFCVRKTDQTMRFAHFLRAGPLSYTRSVAAPTELWSLIVSSHRLTMLRPSLPCKQFHQRRANFQTPIKHKVQTTVTRAPKAPRYRDAGKARISASPRREGAREN